MKVQKPEIGERRAEWVLVGAVIVPILAGAGAIYYLNTKDTRTEARVSPPPVAAAPSNPEAVRPRPFDGKLLGILIHPVDPKKSSARIASRGVAGTFIVGDQVGGAVLEAVNPDHVILRRDEERIVLALTQPEPTKAPPKLDYKAAYEAARQMPGAMETSKPTFEETPPPPAAGNEAFKAALRRAKEGAVK